MLTPETYTTITTLIAMVLGIIFTVLMTQYHTNFWRCFALAFASFSYMFFGVFCL